MKKNAWFTLIELLVWVSLSVILMVSVWVFVTSWMKNITLQKQVLDNSLQVGDFYEKLWNIFNNDFDYVLYFQDEEIDPYYYCIKMEMGHTVYHRFIKEDYEKLVG